jgi:hypothetical protein
MSNEYPWYKLSTRDWIKFGVYDMNDFRVAQMMMNTLHEGGCQAQFAMSPIEGGFSGKMVTKLLKTTGMMDVLVSVQLHKLLHLDEPD